MYTETFTNHYLDRHSVDDHNNLRHFQTSIESTLITYWWVICLFSFIMAISEVNIFLACYYFMWKKEPDKMNSVTHHPKLIHITWESVWFMELVHLLVLDMVFLDTTSGGIFAPFSILAGIYWKVHRSTALKLIMHTRVVFLAVISELANFSYRILP